MRRASFLVSILILAMMNSLINAQDLFQRKTEKKLLFTTPKLHKLSEIQVSPDGWHVAFVEKKDKKFAVHQDGIEHKTYDFVAFMMLSNNRQSSSLPGSDRIKETQSTLEEYDFYSEKMGDISVVMGLIFSPDSAQIAYIAGRSNKKRFAVINGIESDEYDLVYNLMFSPDSKRSAFFAKEDNKYHAVVDGIVSEPYDDPPSEGAFSSDSKHFAYWAYTKKAGYFIVLDGKAQTASKKSKGYFSFSPDGSQYVYILRQRDRDTLFLNGIELCSYPYILRIAFSPDSRRYVYAALGKRSAPFFLPDVKERVVVVENGHESKKFENIDSLIFSPDSRRLAWIVAKQALIGSSYFVVVDGQEYIPKGPLFRNGISDFVFSPNGEHWAYVHHQSLCELVYDGLETKELGDVISHLTFSPDGQRFIYVVNEKRLVEYGTKGTKYGKIEGPLFSPDSHRLAFISSTQKSESVIVDGLEGKFYPRILTWPLFSPDGRHVAYCAEQKNGFCVVIDGLEGEVFDKFVSGGRIVFLDNNRLAYFATQGETFYYVEEIIE